MKHSLQIRTSGIHGKGLFATRPLRAGVVLGTCVVVPSRQAGPYTLSTDAGDVQVTCRFKYINHNDHPNVVYYDDYSVVTLRAIEPGEELTHDYGEAWRETA